MDNLVVTANPNPLLSPMLIVALLSSGLGIALLGSIKVPLAARCALTKPAWADSFRCSASR